MVSVVTRPCGRRNKRTEKLLPFQGAARWERCAQIRQKRVKKRVDLASCLDTIFNLIACPGARDVKWSDPPGRHSILEPSSLLLQAPSRITGDGRETPALRAAGEETDGAQRGCFPRGIARDRRRPLGQVCISSAVAARRQGYCACSYRPGLAGGPGV